MSGAGAGLVELGTSPEILAGRAHGLVPLARAVQAASHGAIAFTLGGVRLSDLDEAALEGIDRERAGALIGELIERPLRPGRYPLERLLALAAEEPSPAELLAALYRGELGFAGAGLVEAIEARLLKVFLLGGAGTGVVSAVQDMVAAFTAAGYHGRAFPLFDPSKKGAPVRGYGVVGREPIRSHAAFERPDVVLLFDARLIALVRGLLEEAGSGGPALLVNSPLGPAELRAAAGLGEGGALFTLDCAALLAGRRIPPNYAMIGGLLGMLEAGSVDGEAFAAVVERSLAEKFGPGEKVAANLEVLRAAPAALRAEGERRVASAALGPIEPAATPPGQRPCFEDGNHAIARAAAQVLDLFPAVIAAYPITPQTPVVEILAQRVADGEIAAEAVTPESEHGAAGALLGAARDRVLAFTATSSQGFALMSEVVHSIAGLRMGNVLISNVLRSLNAPLDVENDHGDLNKVGLDAGYLVFMTRDVQQAYDFHLLAYLVSLYAEYRKRPGARLEMIPDRCVMLPAIVASEGFEVSHAPEGYLVAEPELIGALYEDPAFDYVRRYCETPNWSVTGTLQLSDSRLDTDYQREVAMRLALEVIERVFAHFARLTGRRYGPLDAFNLERAEVLLVVAGAAYGTYEEVARELSGRGVEVAVAHPNVLRPFPAAAWAEALRGRQVFCYDRDDPYGAVGGRLYTELAGVVNEYDLAASGTRLYARIHGLGGRTPSLAEARDECLKALRCAAGELTLRRGKEYVGVNL